MTIDKAIGLLKMAVPMKAVTMSEFNDFIEAVNMAIDALENLPSAEPEHLVKESGDLVKDLVNDCISRQEAIDVIHEDADWLAAQGSDWQVERMERDRSILMSLPSAEPRKKGMWIEKQLPTGWKYSICSNCETDLEIKDEHGTFRKLNFSDCKFCPVCGSYNGGEEE